MFKYVSILVLVTVLSFLGCGGSSSGGGDSGDGGNNVVIDSQQKAVNALAVVGSFMDTTDGLGDIDVLGRDSASMSFPVSKSREAVNIERNCLLSGSMSMIGETGGASTPMNVTTAFVNCKNTADLTQNGSVQVSGSAGDMQMVFTNFSTIDANGTTSMNLTVKLQGTDIAQTVTMNGTITAPEGIIVLTNFVTTDNDTDNSMSMNGTINITSIPSTCADGTYVIETIETLITNPTTDDIVAGKVKINGVVFTFNADGTATATINGAEVNIDTTEDMDINCT